MARKVLLAALLSLTLWGSLPLAFADDCPESTSTSTDSQEHFSSFDILNVEDCQNLGGSTALADEIKEDSEAAGSVAAALILRIINILLLTIGTFAFVTIFYAGILMTIANGEVSKIDRAKSILLQSIIGLLVAFSAYYLVTFVQSFFY